MRLMMEVTAFVTGSSSSPLYKLDEAGNPTFPFPNVEIGSADDHARSSHRGPGTRREFMGILALHEGVQ